MSELTNRFYENAGLCPQKTAIYCDGKSVSYGELVSMVSQCSNFLLSCGIKYGHHIGIPMNNSIESVVLMLSAAELGAALAPINSTLPIEAIRKAMETGKVRHVIARSSFFAQCEKTGGLEISGVRICTDERMLGIPSLVDMINFPPVRPNAHAISGDETYILTMTSGSTGNPKPIELTQNNKVDRIEAHIEQYMLTKDDRILTATPLYHTLAERLVLLPLYLGATAIVLPRFTPRLWLECIAQQKATFTIAVSAQLAQVAGMLSDPSIPNTSSMRCIVSSSALLEPQVKDVLIDKLKCEFHEMYGTSETSTATDIDFNKTSNKKKSVGYPFAGVTLRILRDDASEAALGEVGEIAVRSKLLCKGYYGMDETFSEKLEDGYFRTGDLGYLDEDGYLYFSGRKKELIITGAVNVYPQDVDECVMQLPQVEECAAFAYPDDRLGEVVALAVVLKDGQSATKRDIQRHCAKHLADFQQPQKLFFMDALPKNALGKLTRNKIIDIVKEL